MRPHSHKRRRRMLIVVHNTHQPLLLPLFMLWLPYPPRMRCFGLALVCFFSGARKLCYPPSFTLRSRITIQVNDPRAAPSPVRLKSHSAAKPTPYAPASRLDVRQQDEPSTSATAGSAIAHPPRLSPPPPLTTKTSSSLPPPAFALQPARGKGLLATWWGNYAPCAIAPRKAKARAPACAAAEEITQGNTKIC